jgi:hypothetical protein
MTTTIARPRGLVDRGPLIKPGSTSMSASDKEVAAKVFGEFMQARADRLSLDYEWYVAWRWYEGDTSVFYDRGGGVGAGQIYRIRSRQKRAKRNLPLNLIGHSIDLLVAKQMRARPTFDAGPGAALEEQDRMAARAARKLVRFLWDKNELTAERRSLLLDRCITGNAFVKVYYDQMWTPFRNQMGACPGCHGTGAIQPPAALVEMHQQAVASGIDPAAAGIPPPMPTPCAGCKGGGQVKVGRGPLGDVRIVPVPPWEIWPLPGTKRMEEGCFHAFKMKKELAAATYGFDVGELAADGAGNDAKNQFSQMAREFQLSERDAERDDVWLIEKWQPPEPGTEAPRLTIVCGNKLVWPKPGQPDSTSLPPYGRVPFFHFRLRPAAENFWSSGIVLDMVSANDFVNRTRASFHRNQQTMAFPKWFVEDGAIDKDALVAEEGEVVTYRSSEPPIQRSPATMPDFYQRLYEAEMAHIPRLAGLQEIDTGKAPPNVEAYQALHFLAEQSETVHGPIYLEDERQWRNMATAALVCAVSQYKPTDKRIVRVGGQASVLEVQALLAVKDDLNESIAVRCEVGSALAHSPALRNAQVMDLVQFGILTSQEVKQRGLLDFGVIGGEDMDDHEAQESVAAQENEQIAAGQGHIVLAAVHDHAVHLGVHRRAALEAQMRGDTQTAQLLEMACEQHQAILAPPMPAGGAPSGGTPASGPSLTEQSTPFDSANVSSQYEASGGP